MGMLLVAPGAVSIPLCSTIYLKKEKRKKGEKKRKKEKGKKIHRSARLAGGREMGWWGWEEIIAMSESSYYGSNNLLAAGAKCWGPASAAFVRCSQAHI